MEISFRLMYYIPGMSAEALDQMSVKERNWYHKRLLDQKKMEAEAYRQK